jgi:AraC family transcriptional regulator
LTVKGEPLIDIAYDFGFEYPEVFSRAFKKQFGISPNSCRAARPELDLVMKAVVVERDIVNYQGSLALKGTFEYLEGLHLEGIYAEVDVNDKEFKNTLKEAGDTFLREAPEADWLKQERLYTVVNCHGEDNGKYTVFYGLEVKPAYSNTPYGARIVPEGWYARFAYRGDMFDIREAFVDDLYRWIMVREVRLNPNGVGMLNIFEKDYGSTGNVQIYVPVYRTE